MPNDTSPSTPAGRPTDRPWPVQRRFDVTYHDVDALNHLNHVVYFQYMETLRCDYYLPLANIPDPRAIDMIVAEASCRYLAPAFYASAILGEVAPARPLGRTSFQLLYRFTDPHQPSTVYARGRTVIVSYDYARNEKKPIAPEIRARMESEAVDPTEEGWELPAPRRSPP
jgi:acyl-CoA thioester hydrolase